MHFLIQSARYLKYQLELFLLALSFFSRIPISINVPYSSERMNKAGRYFALVGLLLGALCAITFIGLTQVFSVQVSVFLSIVFSLLLTGAFHEDGLTDMADGIGGGMTIDRRLTIMKDSRIGTYGASALIMALLGKFLLLSQLFQGILNGTFNALSVFTNFSPSVSVFIIWVIAYTLSRTCAASFIFNTAYVSDSAGSKSKPLAEKQSKAELTLLIICGLVPCLLLKLPIIATLIVSTLIFRVLFKKWLVSRLGGFTGDCLGAAQQIMELLIYLVFLALLNPNSLVAING